MAAILTQGRSISAGGRPERLLGPDSEIRSALSMFGLETGFLHLPDDAAFFYAVLEWLNSDDFHQCATWVTDAAPDPSLIASGRKASFAFANNWLKAATVLARQRLARPLVGWLWLDDRVPTSLLDRAAGFGSATDQRNMAQRRDLMLTPAVFSTNRSQSSKQDICSVRRSGANADMPLLVAAVDDSVAATGYETVVSTFGGWPKRWQILVVGDEPWGVDDKRNALVVQTPQPICDHLLAPASSRPRTSSAAIHAERAHQVAV